MRETAVIRPAERRDLEQVYRICLKTGDAGRDATGLYQDPDLIGHIYAGPYLALDGEIGLVAEDADGVLGYAVGAADTRAFEDRLEREWWPALRRRYPLPGRGAGEGTPDDRRIWTLHHPGSVPDAIVTAFPAHVHMNLLPRAQGQGLGSRLLDAWVEQAAERHVPAVHAGVSAANGAGLAFWSARGFKPVHTDPGGGSQGTIWCGRRL